MDMTWLNDLINSGWVWVVGGITAFVTGGGLALLFQTLVGKMFDKLKLKGMESNLANTIQTEINNAIPKIIADIVPKIAGGSFQFDLTGIVKEYLKNVPDTIIEAILGVLKPYVEQMQTLRSAIVHMGDLLSKVPVAEKYPEITDKIILDLKALNAGDLTEKKQTFTIALAPYEVPIETVAAQPEQTEKKIVVPKIQRG